MVLFALSFIVASREILFVVVVSVNFLSLGKKDSSLFKQKAQHIGSTL